eukprot:9477664-Pyramimonas_sp.AAC.1
MACQRRTQAIVSFTSDMGTESKLAASRPADLAAAFPHWLDLAPMEDDGGDADQQAFPDRGGFDDKVGDDAGFESSDGDLGQPAVAAGLVVEDDGGDGAMCDDLGPGEDAQLRLEVVEDNGEENDPQTTGQPPAPALAQLEATMDVIDDCGDDNDNDVPMGPPPPPDPVPLQEILDDSTIGSRAFFHSALLIPGILHTINNSLQDVLRAFTHQKWFLDRAKPLIRL